MSEITVEWAPFALAEGVTENELLEASEALQQEFLAGQQGFVRRELLRGDGDRWCDLVYWRSGEDALQAARNAANSLTCLRYFQLMVNADPADPLTGVQHFAVRAAWQN